jgi:asparagine synthase (glutamine-hydrolysing)
VDRMSMAASLEVRAPILDHHVVEWAARLPEGSKFRHGQGKYLLKKLAARVGVPQEVLDRPKQGFALPLVHWMRGELQDDLLPILLEPRTLGRGYFNPKAIRGLLEEHRRSRRDHSAQIWMLLMFELWHRNFLTPAIGRESQHECFPAVPTPVRHDLVERPESSSVVTATMRDHKMKALECAPAHSRSGRVGCV